MSLLGLRGLLTSADRGGAADDIRLDALQLHLARQPQALLELRALLTGAARSAVADDIRLGTLPLVSHPKRRCRRPSNC